MIPDEAVRAAHAAICEQNIDDCLDPDWRGKCVKAVEAAAPYLLQDAINAANERQKWAQQGVFMKKRDACPPRMEGDKPHCPDCSGIVGETGIVW